MLSEVLANLVGCEELGVFEVVPDTFRLELLAYQGAQPAQFWEPSLPPEAIDEVVRRGRPFAADEAEGDAGVVACFPMKAAGSVMGVIALFGLLPQKAAIDELNRELLDLIGAQAARLLLWQRDATARERSP